MTHGLGYVIVRAAQALIFSTSTYSILIQPIGPNEGARNKHSWKVNTRGTKMPLCVH